MDNDNDNMVFRNQLLYRAPRPTKGPGQQEINIQYYDINSTLTCIVPRRGNSSLGEFIGAINSHIVEFGHLKFSLDMYKDSNFAQTYSSDEFPVMIDEGQTVYVAASTLSITDVRLSIESCRVTPTNNPDDSMKHMVMENGYV